MKSITQIRGGIGFFAALFAIAVAMVACEAPTQEFGEGGALDSPIGIAIHGDYAYITNANFDLSDDKEGWIAVIDLYTALRNRKKCILNRMITEPYIGDIVINDEGSLAYIANRKQDLVMLVDLSDPVNPEIIDMEPEKKGIQGIKVGIAPVALALSPDETFLFAANVGSGDLSIIDTATRKLIKNERLGAGINAVAVDPEGKYVYVSNKGLNSISLLEIETGKFVTSFAVGDQRSGIGQDTRDIDFSKDGRYAYISAGEPPSIMVVDTDKLPHYPDRAVIEYIPMDSKPTAVKLSPDGSELWVANYFSSAVYVVDTYYHEIIDVVDTGIGPYDIAFFPGTPQDPDHYYALVTCFYAHNLSLIDARSKELIWAIP